MERRQFIKQMLGHGVIGVTAGWSVGCGTLFHSERCGRPHSNQLDWKIVALDGLGLILFFVPGVVAFAVDFWTGAIYLPYEESYPPYGVQPMAMPTTGVDTYSPAPQTTAPPPTAQPVVPPVSFRRVDVPRQQLNLNRIEEIASHHVGQPVSLADNQARLSTLGSVDRFNEQLARHHSDNQFGQSVRAFFQRHAQV